VVPANQQLVVEHGEMKGFMEAMTMGYKVDPPSLLNKLRAETMSALPSTRSARPSSRLRSSASDGTAQENIYASQSLARLRGLRMTQSASLVFSLFVYTGCATAYTPPPLTVQHPAHPEAMLPGATAVGHARLWASGPALSAAGHRHGAA